MKRISSSLEKIRDHYEVVVIGSGYGGGIAASRMARAGRKVCLLERGKEIMPPHFPNELKEVIAEAQLDTPVGNFGSKTGLYNVKMNDQMNALVGCGLGGTSLINANVALEVDSKILEQDAWPERYRNGELLKPYYKRAAIALGSNPYPRDDLNKVKALQKSAKAMEVTFYKPPINVTFKDGKNHFGIKQKACNNCGDCCTGCNNLAKNTTQMNYLPDAYNSGADIFCEAHVDKLSKDGDKWVVHLSDMSTKVEALHKVTADHVFVCAGTYGSTELLLRSRKSLSFSDKLGHGFSGNGDAIAFGYNSYWKFDEWHKPRPLNAIGIGDNDVSTSKYPGPCIAGIIDNRKDVPIDQGRVIEEGVFPGAFATALPPLFFFADTQYGNFLRYGAKQANQRLNDAKSLGEVIQESPGSLSAESYDGPMSRMQTYLVMSHDDAGGTLSIDENERLKLEWKGVGQSRSIIDDNAAVKQANLAIEGQFLPNPMWTEPANYRLITVHPLGGCPMAESAKDGVVSPTCEVFTGDGAEIHEGLYVMDGSVFPCAAGVNPLLTISAISEYAVEEMAKKNAWTIDYDVIPFSRPGQPAPKNPDAKTTNPFWRFLKWLLSPLEAVVIWIATTILDLLIKIRPNFFSPGMHFTETMEGFVTKKFVDNQAPPYERISSNYDIAKRQGEADGTALKYLLTIKTDDVNKFTKNHLASVTGTVTCPLFSDKPMNVTKGHFILFDADEHQVETWTMVYSLQLERDGEAPVRLEGRKYLHKKPDSHWWNDITTLYVRMYDGLDKTSAPQAIGIITLNINDAVRQANTLKIWLPDHWWLNKLVHWFPEVGDILRTLFGAKFVGFCAQTIFKAYGGLLADLENFPQIENKKSKKNIARVLRLPEPEMTTLKLKDGAQIKLYRYRQTSGEAKGQVVMAPGFSVTANSFATPTVDTNLVEYLYHDGDESADSEGGGYDVWLLAYRASPDSGNKVTDYTIDDIATLDWPAAIAHIKSASNDAPLHAVAHCVGSMSLMMSMLNGTQGIASMVSSQLTVHPVTNWFNFLKADIGLVEMIEKGIKTFKGMKKKVSLRPYTGKTKSKVEASAQVDVLCWQLPVPPGQECKNPVCRRVFGIFGPSYTHAQLNHKTHIAMEDWFDEIATKPFEQIEKIVELEYVVNAKGKDVYLKNVENLALPISFIAGADNQIFRPETSLRTYEWVRYHNKNTEYDRHVFEGYAHMDCFIGKNANRDIFPYIKNALDKQL